MLKKWDERRDIAIPGNRAETIAFAHFHWIEIAKQAIQEKGRFTVALSGGSTPKAIYESFTKTELDWTKVWLFWSDERSVKPDHPDSNYHMAMEAGFKKFPIPSSQIFRMKAENTIEMHALEYDKLIQKHLRADLFDLVMLGIGEDGHTASLFPNTKALKIHNQLVAANYIDEKKSWRMTLTYPCINKSKKIVIYAVGIDKKMIIHSVLQTDDFPASFIGTEEHKAVLILDNDAASGTIPIS